MPDSAAGSPCETSCLLDSTYNDKSGPPTHKKSTMQYLLVKNNGQYVPAGNVLHEEKPTKFTFPTLAGSNYDAGSEYDADSDYGSGNGTITLSQTECSLIPKEKATLTYTIDGDWDYSSVSVVWSSSDTKVAKVDKKGVVTAVAPGTATIFLTASGMAAECKIYVDQVKAVKSESTGKASESVSLGIDGAKKDSKTIALTVDMGKSPHTAEWMIQQGKTDAPQAVCSKQSVAVTDLSVSDNCITVTLQAVSQGNANVSVKFAGKTVTLKVAAGQLITKEMFDVTWPETVKEEGEIRTTPYTVKIGKNVLPDTDYKITWYRGQGKKRNASPMKAAPTAKGKFTAVITVEGSNLTTTNKKKEIVKNFTIKYKACQPEFSQSRS